MEPSIWQRTPPHNTAENGREPPSRRASDEGGAATRVNDGDPIAELSNSPNCPRPRPMSSLAAATCRKVIAHQRKPHERENRAHRQKTEKDAAAGLNDG